MATAPSRPTRGWPPSGAVRPRPAATMESITARRPSRSPPERSRCRTSGAGSGRGQPLEVSTGSSRGLERSAQGRLRASR
jgi:hypothetical protein